MISSQPILAVHGEHRDAVRVAHEEVVIGLDVDRVPSIGSQHGVEQDARVLAEVASVADIERGTDGMARMIR